jgi:phage shock protein C
MFCTKCGVELPEREIYCSQCGHPTEKASAARPVARQLLLRARYNKKIAGVCAGMAKYLDVDPTLMRVLWLLLLFALPPAGLIGYLAAWIVMPLEPEAYPPTVVQPGFTTTATQ